MDKTCRYCKHWTPGGEADYAEKVAEMGYGACELVSRADLEGPDYPFAFTGLDNVELATHASFGCNQWER